MHRKQEAVYAASPRLLRWHARIHLALPLVVLVLVAVVVIEFLLDPGPRLAQASLVGGYLVVLYFVLELAVEYGCYRDRRQFFRDRYVDILLTVPLIVVFPFAVGISSFVLSIRTLQVLETAALVRFDLLLLQEATVAGTKLQKVGKLLRSSRTVIRERLIR